MVVVGQAGEHPVVCHATGVRTRLYRTVGKLEAPCGGGDHAVRRQVACGTRGGAAVSAEPDLLSAYRK